MGFAEIRQNRPFTAGSYVKLHTIMIQILEMYVNLITA